jgi:hypothetical protein
MDSGQDHCIQANADIAGIGIRVSLYVQAFLMFLTALFRWASGYQTFERQYDRTHPFYTSLLLTSCALLISAMAQAAIGKLSTYHALIVLNLSWINNITVIALMDRPTMGEFRRAKSSSAKISRNIFIIMTSAHLCLTGAFGLWVWGVLERFGPNPGCTIGLSFGFFTVRPNLARPAWIFICSSGYTLLKYMVYGFCPAIRHSFIILSSRRIFTIHRIRSLGIHPISSSFRGYRHAILLCSCYGDCNTTWAARASSRRRE